MPHPTEVKQALLYLATPPRFGDLVGIEHLNELQKWKQIPCKRCDSLTRERCETCEGTGLMWVRR